MALKVTIVQSRDQNEEIALKKQQADNVFWGLGSRHWMQIIDGKYHEYGPRVFDEALHQGVKEPGFFQSLEQGCNFAAEHLMEDLNVQFYKDLHKVLCAHFKGRENNTEMESEKAGSFKEKSIRCRPSIANISDESREHYFYVEIYYRTISENEILSDTDRNKKYSNLLSEWFEEAKVFNKMDFKWLENRESKIKEESNFSQTIAQQYPISKEWVSKWELDWENKIKAIDDSIQKACEKLGVDKFISIQKIGEKTLDVSYNCVNPQQNELIVEKLFDCYNQRIHEINETHSRQSSQEKTSQLITAEKVDAIADLFQMLEWLHPFPDGQGRVDLVLLAKILSEQELNPPILEDPYTSTHSLLSEWKKDLLKGMERWKIEQKRL